MDQPIEQPNEPQSRFGSRKKVIAISLVSLFLLIGTTILVLKPTTTSYRPKAENEPNPQCRLEVNIAAAAPTETPSSGPSSTPTTRPTATRTLTPTRTPTLRPTATFTPSLKPTFTPTPTRIPLPVPFPFCNSLTMKESDGSNNESIVLGQSVTLTVSLSNSTVSNYGILFVGKCNDPLNCTQIYGQTVSTELTRGNQISYFYTPPSAGKYVFEVNAYESAKCDFFCSAGTYRYQYNVYPPACTTTSNYGRIDGPGTCTNNCRKYLTVTSP